MSKGRHGRWLTDVGFSQDCALDLCKIAGNSFRASHDS